MTPDSGVAGPTDIPILLGYTTITFGYDFWKAQV
jgi:hypothetical protein